MLADIEAKVRADLGMGDVKDGAKDTVEEA